MRTQLWKGLFEVKHLVKEKPNVFMSPKEVENKYCTKICPLTYGIISAVKDLWKKQELAISTNNH